MNGHGMKKEGAFWRKARRAMAMFAAAAGLTALPSAIAPGALVQGGFAPALGLAALGGPTALAAQETHVVVVAGLGGEARFREAFVEWGATLHDAALAAGVAPERVHFLAEDPQMDPARIGGRSTAEEVEAVLGRVAREAAAGDRVLLVLLGHGAGSGENSRVSLPGPSLRAADYARLLDAIPARSVAVVNAASASGDFIPVLAGEGRVVITATRSAQQRNATVFGGHFVEAFAGNRADLDRDGRVSLLEAFEYARRETERHFVERGLLASEHAMFAEGPDARGAHELPEGAGVLARSFVLAPAVPTVAVDDPEVAARLQELYAVRAELETRLDELVARRDRMDPQEHQVAMQQVLVELARLGQEIRALEGGGS